NSAASNCCARGVCTGGMLVLKRAKVLLFILVGADDRNMFGREVSGHQVSYSDCGFLDGVEHTNFKGEHGFGFDGHGPPSQERYPSLQNCNEQPPHVPCHM